MPKKRGLVPGKAPSPMRVVVTGMENFWAREVSSLEALERITPPPA
jgi:hypothetical protein